jgi:hypothetical protein
LRSRLYDVAVRRQNRSWHVMKHAAETRGGGWARIWDEGVGDVILRSPQWLADNESELRESLAASRENAASFAEYVPHAGRRSTPANLCLREATAADVGGCVDIITSLNGDDGAGWRAMIERTIAAVDQALFVANLGGEIAGYARIVDHRVADDAPADAAPAGTT